MTSFIGRGAVESIQPWASIKYTPGFKTRSLVGERQGARETFAAFWRNSGYPRPGMVTDAYSLF
jgi:hypothetical protein